MPEIILTLYCATDGIKGKLEHPLTLRGDGPIVYEGLGSLSVFTLEHHAELLPPSVAAVSLLRVNVKGLWEVKIPGIEHYPTLRLMGELKLNVGAS